MSDAVRVAVVSTPRSGNTWVRLLLAATYRVPELAVHELSAADWDALPAECVLQIHWQRTPEFAARLAAGGFRVVTVARHPLDTLVSILPFALMDGDTHNWLLGEGGDETGIFAATPRTRAFVNYATGPRATALLGVTGGWWGRPGVVGVRYEDLVADPVGELGTLCAGIAPPREPDLAAVVAGHTLSKLRPRAGNGHFWQGRPGQWRELLPAAEATEIAAANPAAFSRYGYACDPDPALDAAAADANWVRLAGPALRAGMERSYASEAKADAHYQAAEESRRQAAASAAEVARLTARVAELEARIAPFAGLRGFEVRVARRLGRFRDRVTR